MDSIASSTSTNARESLHARMTEHLFLCEICRNAGVARGADEFGCEEFRELRDMHAKADPPVRPPDELIDVDSLRTITIRHLARYAHHLAMGVRGLAGYNVPTTAYYLRTWISIAEKGCAYDKLRADERDEIHDALIDEASSEQSH